MTDVIQQVNLYRGGADKDKIDASARVLLLAGVGILLTVLLLALAGEFYLSRLTSERQQLAGQLRAQQAGVDRMRDSLPSLEPDPFLESELQRLQQSHRGLADNLALLRAHSMQQGAGFSPVFAGLARNTLDGIWLNKVGLADGGAGLWLRGQTSEPALVPRLLQTLAVEPAFQGRTFRKVTFERRTVGERPLVDFELRSAQPGGEGDAG